MSTRHCAPAAPAGRPPADERLTGAPTRFVPRLRCPRCGHTEATVVCRFCCGFKLRRSVPPFAHELDDDLRVT